MAQRRIVSPHPRASSSRFPRFLRSALPLLLPLLLLLLPVPSQGGPFLAPDGSLREGGPPPGSLRGEAPVELKNGDSRSLSVPLGAVDGVTTSSDFRLVLPTGRTVLVYPAEIYGRRFWSQPLTEEEFGAVTVGSPVERVTLSPEEHARVRADGEARRKEAAARREEERRDTARKEAEALEAARGRLLDRRDDLERRIARAEQEVAREEESLFRRNDSDEGDAERVRKEIDDLTDQRQELSDRRTTLAIEGGSKAAVDRLTREIQGLSARISSDRDNLRAIRDRIRGNRSGYERAVLDLRTLLSERRRLEGDVREADRKIREKEKEASRPSPR